MFGWGRGEEQEVMGGVLFSLVFFFREGEENLEGIGGLSYNLKFPFFNSFKLGQIEASVREIIPLLMNFSVFSFFTINN